MSNKKEYVPFSPNATGGYLAASDLYFECRNCGETVPSLPNENAYCKCRNIIVDIEAGRVSVKRPMEMKLVRLKSN